MTYLNHALRILIAVAIAAGTPLGLSALAREPDSAFSAWSLQPSTALEFSAVSLPAISFRAFSMEGPLVARGLALPSVRYGYRAFAGGVQYVPAQLAASGFDGGFSAWAGGRGDVPAGSWSAGRGGASVAWAAGSGTVPVAAAYRGGYENFSALALDRSLIADAGMAVDGAMVADAKPFSFSAVVPLGRRSLKDSKDSLDAAPPEPDFRPPTAIGGNDDAIPIPDRWRIVENLKLKKENVMDPYNQNTLKGDRPIYGKDWFINLNVISDSLVEFRRIPTPVGNQAELGGRNDAFGDGEQQLFQQNLITSISLIKGNTTFRPPDYEFRFTGVTNFNYSTADVAGLLNADPSDSGNGQDTRFDNHFAVQELFIDKHLRNKSDRYDFDSLRVGIQPFISDFRGFIFQDQQPGVRLFGNFNGNRIQYNLAAFRRLNKDTNSGLNEFVLRKDDVYIANLYYQDFPVLGFQLQGTVIHNRNREGDERRRFDENNFLIRPAAFGNQLPHNYQVTYFGLNGDGHFDRLNLTFALYHALGTDERNQIADRKIDIRALFGALEASIDFDYYRLKAFGLYSSGDRNPLDSVGTGFDAILENPQFAGADTSFFQRQAIPLVGGGRVALSGQNALIPSLRSSKTEGQSNFVNPGLRLIGVGADIDILPELRLILNASYLDFDATSSLRILRTQGKIDRHIGEDISAAIVYRPLFINNVLVRLSVAGLFPGDGFDALFDRNGKNFQFSTLANVVLTY